jgi:ubiquinone/menaquinone biosynthesis C-methylase UbiE
MSDQIISEFGRQAAAMAAAPAFNEQDTIRRIRTAMGAYPAGKVLEVACGPGIVAEAIAPLVSELVCIDATPEMITLAKSRLEASGVSNVDFREAYAESIPFAEGTFDAIVTRLSFHHFVDMKAVLAEFRRVLRPKGRLIVADIISSAEPCESRLHNALEQLRDPTHVHMFSKNEFQSALTESGYKLLTEETWDQQRSFSEWAKIVSVPGRTGPLREVMWALSNAGIKAGIELHEKDSELYFVHTWMLVSAEAT